MKHQALFSLKDKSKKIQVSSAAVMLGSLRVKLWTYGYIRRYSFCHFIHLSIPMLFLVLPDDLISEDTNMVFSISLLSPAKGGGI